MNRQKGFTLIEGMVVTAMIAIIAGVMIPVMRGQSDSALNAEAIAFANAMNQAKVVYRTTVDDAETTWAAASGDQAKYALLVGAGLMEGWPTTCNGYPDARFTYSLYDLSGTQTMALPRSNGTLITATYNR